MLVSLSKTCNGRNNVKLKENNRSEQSKATIKVQLTFAGFGEFSYTKPRKTMSFRGQSSTCSNCGYMEGAYSLPRSTCRRGLATRSGRSKWLISARTWPSWTALWTIPPTTTKYSLGRESTSVPWMWKTRVLSTTSSRLPVPCSLRDMAHAGRERRDHVEDPTSTATYIYIQPRLWRLTMPMLIRYIRCKGSIAGSMNKNITIC